MLRPFSSGSLEPLPAAPASSPESLLTSEDAAILGGCAPCQLRELARRGDVPSYRLGNGPKARLRLKWSEVEAALRSGNRRKS
jgi:hypothetical protein